MTPTPSKSTSERAELVREAREMAAYYRAYDTTWPADMLDRLADALEAADADTQRQQAFAYKCAETCWDGNNIDGGDMQEWLTEAGWLVPTEMAAPCHPEACRCAEYDCDFPTTCYRFAARAAEETTR